MAYNLFVSSSTASSASLTEHGWAQVLDGGKWKLCDVSMRQFMAGRHLVLSYVPAAVYRLRAENGRAAWKKEA